MLGGTQGGQIYSCTRSLAKPRWRAQNVCISVFGETPVWDFSFLIFHVLFRQSLVVQMMCLIGIKTPKCCLISPFLCILYLQICIFVFANMCFCICIEYFFFGCADRAADWHRGPQMLLAVPSSVSRLTITMPPNVSWLTSLIPMYPNVSQCILINSPDTKPLCRRRRVKYNCHFGWTPIGEIAAKTKKLRFNPN